MRNCSVSLSQTSENFLLLKPKKLTSFWKEEKYQPHNHTCTPLQIQTYGESCLICELHSNILLLHDTYQQQYIQFNVLATHEVVTIQYGGVPYIFQTDPVPPLGSTILNASIQDSTPTHGCTDRCTANC